jgi:alkanesulfonate monooxygenase SsuD/methylene tetrahydromethanopterin reductase-like flavin-dependent oxidoreductase (luciferase family)
MLQRRPAYQTSEPIALEMKGLSVTGSAASFNMAGSGEESHRMALEFGIFDHVDHSGVPLSQFYEDRFKLVEAYDRAGFYGYHCAEHHSTPLGMAPSPSVYLAAIAQRTKRLRFGPLVYTLALYHPIRLAEEICMLDQISRGRLMLGVGKGISQIELGYYGVDYGDADGMYREALAIILQALTEKKVDFEGKYYRYKDVPFELEPFQKPHPPLWYGVLNADSGERAARARMNIVANGPAHIFRTITERYRATYQPPPGGGEYPKMAINRMVMVAETEAEALAISRRAYRRWWASFMKLWHMHNLPATNVVYPPEIDGQIADGRSVVGTPEQVAERLQAQLDESGSNYLVVRFGYGDLTLSESLHALDLFQRHVMPALREGVRVAAE